MQINNQNGYGLFPAAQITAFEIMGINVSDEARVFPQQNHRRALFKINPLPTCTFRWHWRPAIDPDSF